MSFATYLPTVSETRLILGDPALNFRWIASLPTDVYSGYTSTNSYSPNGIAVGGSGFLTIPVVPRGRVETISLPGITIDAEGRFGAASKTHYPRWLEVEPCQLTMYEDMNYNTLNYFKNWQNMVVDNNHNYYPANYYKRSIFFFAFDPVSSSSPTMSIELQGAWPTNPGAGMTYEYNASGMVTLAVNISVDDIQYSFSPNQIDAPRGVNNGPRPES